MYIDLGDIFKDTEWAALFTDKNALPQFSLKRGQRKYVIVGWHGKTEYCYTPHRAKDGYFYTFEYVTVWRDPRMKTKKGRAELAKTRMPYERQQLKHLTKARTRKLAYKRACDRYNAACARAIRTQGRKAGATAVAG